MKKQSKLKLVLCLLLVSSLYASAQLYTCDFEDEAERGSWILNAGREGGKCKNRWYSGTAVHNGGAYSLYISADQGATAGYIAEGTTVVAYRELTLPAGKYELSFDWQAVGYKDDALYVCWMPVSEMTTSVPNNSNLPAWVKLNAIEFEDGSTKLASSAWKTTYATLESDGTPHKLVFVWNNGVVTVAPPAACIDNIYILPLGKCERPKNITINISDSADGINIKWKGNADAYDLKVKLPGTSELQSFDNYTGDSLFLPNSNEGVCEVYIRSRCADAFTAWVSHRDFIYFKGWRCVDFFDLTDQNCYYGDGYNSKIGRGCYDFGHKSMYSKHTVHWDTTERDPRTGGLLRTVPEGEIASVRVGNWGRGAESECIEYDYHVDASTNAILILKYAAVLQDPGHPAQNQPRFTLRFFDSSGKSIEGAECVEADFTAGQNTDGWYLSTVPSDPYIPGQPDGKEPPLWKDWTTVGVNLQPYDGQDIKISLSTYDCVQLGHYGYAYFTINCTSAKVTGLSCGDSEVNRFSAPEGFRYHWYKKSDPEKTLVSDERELVLEDPRDTATYACDVINPNPGLEHCFYTIYVSALPHYPFPYANYKYEVVDCQNQVSFNDLSRIILLRPNDNGKIDTIVDPDQLVDSIMWDFGDGSPVSYEKDPVHFYPSSGGKYTVRLTAFFAECSETTQFEIEMEETGMRYRTLQDTVCENDMENWDGIEFTYNGPGLYTVYDTIPLPNGCDSIVTLELFVPSSTTSEISDTICSDELPYTFNGTTIDEAGEYTIVIDNQYGCDSTIAYTLLVNESLRLNMSNEIDICADDENLVIPYELLSGMVTSYDILFKDADVNDALGVVDGGVPEENKLVVQRRNDILPNVYKGNVVFKNLDCGNVEIPVSLNVNYPDSIIAQRWNDVLGVKNSSLNGGYDFVMFQWYKNDTPLVGRTSANLYEEAGLDTEAEYKVLLTRKSDGVSMFTCPVKPATFDVEDVPVIVIKAAETITVQAQSYGVARILGVTGILVSVTELEPGSTAVRMPSVPGVYLLDIHLQDGRVYMEKIIVR